MKYLGSKARHADEILAHVLARRVPGQTYVEPFVGGANVMNKVPQDQGPRIGADLNAHMVALHTALGAGWQPPEKMSRAEYMAIRKNPDAFPKELVAFAATGVTFGSMWMGEYVKDGPGENRCRQSRDSCLRDAPGLAGATFIHCSYDVLEIPPRSLVYCDPPYTGTTGYEGAKTKIKVGEDSNKNAWKAGKFWKWADALVDAGHTVFVSEYTGPDPSIYNMPVTEAEQMVRAEAAAYQKSDGYTTAGMDAYFARIAEFEDTKRKMREQLAARWEVVWQKEVVSDFSASREAGTNSGKKEVEKLFHRDH